MQGLFIVRYSTVLFRLFAKPNQEYKSSSSSLSSCFLLCLHEPCRLLASLARARLTVGDCHRAAEVGARAFEVSGGGCSCLPTHASASLLTFGCVRKVEYISCSIQGRYISPVVGISVRRCPSLTHMVLVYLEVDQSLSRSFRS